MRINEVWLSGYVGQDPTPKDINGTRLLELSIATTEKRKDQEDITYWHDVNIWGKTAENLEPFIKKGSRLFIRGKLTYNTWEKDGQKHKSTKIFATNVQLVDKRSQTEDVRETGTNNNDELPF